MFLKRCLWCWEGRVRDAQRRAAGLRRSSDGQTGRYRRTGEQTGVEYSYCSERAELGADVRWCGGCSWWLSRRINSAKASRSE